MNLKFVNDIERRERVLAWAKNGTIGIAPVISKDSLIFSIAHLMRLEHELNCEILNKREAEMWQPGDIPNPAMLPGRFVL